MIVEIKAGKMKKQDKISADKEEDKIVCHVMKVSFKRTRGKK